MQQNMKSYFGPLDYIIFVMVLAVSSAIGLYYRFTGGKQKTFKEYMMANNSMSVLPVSFSLMASFMSAITILGVSKENYMYGTQFVVINFSYLISTPIVCYLYLPVFFKLQNTSVYEYLERRFGRLTRTCASLAFSLQMTLYMGIVLYAPALALSVVTGISLSVSIIAVGVVCTFYSALGGMKAVLITDVFQSLLMFAAIFAVITRGVLDFSVSEIFKIADEGNRLEFFNVSPDPRVRHTLWSLGVGGCFTYCSLYGVNQAQVQRLLTIKDLHRAQASLWIQWPILTLLSLSTSFAGLVLYAQYHTCDPFQSGRIKNSDQLLPLYVMDTMGMVPGLSGLFVSGIFSGSLSTVSSALNSLAAVTYQDYILPCIPHERSFQEKYATRISKILACVYGIICMIMAFLIPLVGTGILQASLTIFGAVGGPLLALFTMGMLCRCANQKGAMAGLLFGLVITLWIGFGQPKPPLPFKPVSVEGCPSSNASLVIESLQMINSSNYIGDKLYFDGLSNISVTLPLEGKEGLPAISLTELNTTLPLESTSFLHNLYAMSYMWVAALGFIVTMVVGVLVSIATGGNMVLERELFSSWVHISETANNITENFSTEKLNQTSPGDLLVSGYNLNPDDKEMSRL